MSDKIQINAYFSCTYTCDIKIKAVIFTISIQNSAKVCFMSLNKSVCNNSKDIKDAIIHFSID